MDILKLEIWDKNPINYTCNQHGHLEFTGCEQKTCLDEKIELSHSGGFIGTLLDYLDGITDDTVCGSPSDSSGTDPVDPTSADQDADAEVNYCRDQCFGELQSNSCDQLFSDTNSDLFNDAFRLHDHHRLSPQDVNYLFKLKNDGGNFLPNETKVMIGNTCIDKYSGTEGADEMQPTIPVDLCMSD